MKATLRFDLDDPDDRLAHERCVRALDMALAISRVLEMIRKVEKYTDDRSTTSYGPLLTEIREELWEYSELTR